MTETAAKREIAEPKLSKMQTVRKRELRRAITRLHERLKLSAALGTGLDTYGLRVAITVLGEMRKEINVERIPESD